MSARQLEGFRLTIRANGTLGALVHLWRDKARTVPYDLTAYSGFYSSVKELLTDTAELMVVTVSISTLGLDASGNEIAVTAADGWLQLFASSDETTKVQGIAKAADSGNIRGFIDLFGVDGAGNRVPLGFGFADLVPSVTEVF